MPRRDEAHEVGIIDELVPEDSSETVLDRALSIAGDIIQRPPLAVAHIKRLARQSQQPVTADMLKMESRLFAELMQTEEAKALLAAPSLLLFASTQRTVGIPF